MKNPCLYHFWFWSIVVTNFQDCHCGHIKLLINAKTTYYEYAHQEEYLYKISSSLDNYDVMAAILVFFQK